MLECTTTISVGDRLDVAYVDNDWRESEVVCIREHDTGRIVYLCVLNRPDMDAYSSVIASPNGIAKYHHACFMDSILMHLTNGKYYRRVPYARPSYEYGDDT